MRLNRKQAFGIAAIIAAVAAVLVYYLLSSSAKSQQQAEKPQMVGVVMATTNIPAYTTVTPGMVEIKQIPTTTAPDNALSQTSQVVGRLSQSAIANGQLLVRGDVVEASASQGLTFVIPKGKRAVTVALDAISGVGGFVTPNDHVDILATFELDKSASTRVILQNIEVLAMNEQTARPQAARSSEGDSGTKTTGEAPTVEKVKNATLAVTPEEAQRLILAAHEGSIHLILRSRQDINGMHDLAATTDWELMGMPPPEPDKPEVVAPTPDRPQNWPPGYSDGTPPTTPAPPAASAGPTIEVIRGSEHSTVTTGH